MVGVETAVVAGGFSVTTALVSVATAGSAGSAVGPAAATGIGCTSVDMVEALWGTKKKGHTRLLKTREHVQLDCSETTHPQHWALGEGKV